MKTGIPATFILDKISFFSDLEYPPLASIDEIVHFFRPLDKFADWYISYDRKNEFDIEVLFASKKEVINAYYKVIGDFEIKQIMKKLQEIKLSVAEERKQKLIEIFGNE
jgi:hypothetical protein